MADWTNDATLIASLAAGKAFTDEKAQALAENTVALGEKAANVPAAYRLGKWLLGTIATTAGSTVSISGLDLTQYVGLEIAIRGVSTNNNTSVLRLGSGGGVSPLTGSLVAAMNSWHGLYFIDLSTGFMMGASNTDNNNSEFRTACMSAGTINNATTGFSFSLSAGNFDAGSGQNLIAIYGVR